MPCTTRAIHVMRCCCVRVHDTRRGALTYVRVRAAAGKRQRVRISMANVCPDDR